MAKLLGFPARMFIRVVRPNAPPPQTFAVANSSALLTFF